LTAVLDEALDHQPQHRKVNQAQVVRAIAQDDGSALNAIKFEVTH
jgi:hypothetical protein